MAITALETWIDEYLDVLRANPPMCAPAGDAEESEEAATVLRAWWETVRRDAEVEEVSPGCEALRRAVEGYLYGSALSGCGTRRLDGRLSILKHFSAWCAGTGRLPFDFAAAVPWIGRRDPQLERFVRSQWGLSDRFYGIET